ncbi:hypothetical protein CAAN3_05S05138 [[Candida] anglica]
MAKSLRSKSKLRAKSVKRKGEFAKFVDGRNDRLAAKLEEHTKKQEEEKAAKKAQDPEVKAEETEGMEVDYSAESTTDKKVSTSGWRDSRNQIYKQRKLKGKKGKVVKF